MQPASCVIRNEVPADLEAIRAVHRTSFPTHMEADIVDALRARGELVVSLVACVDDVVVGHVAFSPVRAGNSATGIGLAPVAVVPDYRQQGIAAALIEIGLAECRTRGYDFAVVLGDPGYYGRFGFAPASLSGLTDEYGGGDAFQALALRDGGLAGAAGTVRYSAAFDPAAH